jgi:hypothetical protein
LGLYQCAYRLVQGLRYEQLLREDQAPGTGDARQLKEWVNWRAFSKSRFDSSGADDRLQPPDISNKVETATPNRYFSNGHGTQIIHIDFVVANVSKPNLRLPDSPYSDKDKSQTGSIGQVLRINVL